MNKKKSNPFVGLNKLNKKEYVTANAFDLLDIVESEAPSYQEEETRDMFLFLYFINILMKANLDFIVQGGILLATKLNEHFRRTRDIDVIVKNPDKFYKDVEDAISNSGSDITFKAKFGRKKEANEWFYKNTFNLIVSAYHNQDLINVFVVDGVYVDYYDEIEKIKYYGPKIIDEDFYYYGVDIEYVISTKILAISSELPRPVKHLVDLYSLIKLELDIGKIKKYLKIGLQRENVIRKKLGKEELIEDYKIKANKQFLGNYVYEVISSGNQIGFKEMKEEVNKWINASLYGALRV